MKLLIATGNQGKLREMRTALAPLRLDIISSKDLVLPDVEETGSTFLENARLKAHTLARASGLVTLADDSGLEVDALDGAPGVRSARYAGLGATDAENNRKLLEALRCVPESGRTARFRCVLVVAAPQGEEWVSEGVCEGVIATEARGTQGFGYDPLFIPVGHGRTFGELDPEVKQRMSHRAKALSSMMDHLRRNLDSHRAIP